MKKKITRLAACALLLPSAGVFADMYKCKDEAGRLSYQEQPCANNAREQQMNVATVGPERLVRSLFTITQHKDQSDVNFIQKVLGARLELHSNPTADAPWTEYHLASSEKDFPATAIKLSVLKSAWPRTSFLYLKIAHGRACVTEETIKAIFGPAVRTTQDEGAKLVFYKIPGDNFRQLQAGFWGEVCATTLTFQPQNN